MPKCTKSSRKQGGGLSVFSTKIPYICKECRFSATNIRNYISHVIVVHMPDESNKKSQPLKSKKLKSTVSKNKKIVKYKQTDYIKSNVLESTLPEFSETLINVSKSPEYSKEPSIIKLRKFSRPTVSSELIKEVLNSSIERLDNMPRKAKRFAAAKNVLKEKNSIVEKRKEMSISKSPCNPSKQATNTIAAGTDFSTAKSCQQLTSKPKSENIPDIAETCDLIKASDVKTNSGKASSVASVAMLKPGKKSINNRNYKLKVPPRSSQHTNMENSMVYQPTDMLDNFSDVVNSFLKANSKIQNHGKGKPVAGGAIQCFNSTAGTPQRSDTSTTGTPKRSDDITCTLQPFDSVTETPQPSDTAKLPVVLPSTVQTQTEPWVVACVKVNTKLINSDCKIFDDGEVLKVVALESCSKDLGHDISAAVNNNDWVAPKISKIASINACSSDLSRNDLSAANKPCPLILKPTEFDESMQTLLESGMVTMPCDFDSSIATDEVAKILNKSFVEFPYPPAQRLKRLSSTTKLSVFQLKSWFVNARIQNGISWDPDEIHDAWSYLQDF